MMTLKLAGSKGGHGRANRAGSKVNKIEFGSHVETSVESYGLVADEALKTRFPLD
jgi:hypothetical protein